MIDSDLMESPWRVFTEAYEVLNNLPTAPTVRINPPRPVTSSTLEAFPSGSTDIESNTITYVYAWYRDGELIPNLTSSQVSSIWLTRGQNWTVEVRADDGDGLGPPGIAWKVIQNAMPGLGEILPTPRYRRTHRTRTGSCSPTPSTTPTGTPWSGASTRSPGT